MTLHMKHVLLATAASLVAATSWAGLTATPNEAAINGVWQMVTPAFKELKDANGKTPPLNAEGKKLYDQRKAMLAKGDKSFDLTEKCKPMGFPRTLWDGSPFDMQVITGEQVFQGFTFNRNHRLFAEWTDQPPVMQIPRYYGSSSAHWEGSTLVVQSGLYNDNQLLDSSGLPLSQDMTLVERYIPAKNGKSMNVRLTVTDPTYYTKPWEISVKFNKVPNGRIEEDVCEERSEFYKPLLKGR
jgi:hypothetical protein